MKNLRTIDEYINMLPKGGTWVLITLHCGASGVKYQHPGLGVDVESRGNSTVEALDNLTGKVQRRLLKMQEG